MNSLRQEAARLVSETRTVRPAALRRSMRSDAMYATDLPQIADREAFAGFVQRAEKAGWQIETENGWTHLDRVPETITKGGFQGPYGQEAGCCASILERHAGEERKDGKEVRRMLLKAGEEGAEAYEKICSRLHREWAAALRNNEKLPELASDFFTGGTGNDHSAHRTFGIPD